MAATVIGSDLGFAWNQKSHLSNCVVIICFPHNQPLSLTTVLKEEEEKIQVANKEEKTDKREGGDKEDKRNVKRRRIIADKTEEDKESAIKETEDDKGNQCWTLYLSSLVLAAASSHFRTRFSSGIRDASKLIEDRIPLIIEVILLLLPLSPLASQVKK